VCVGVEMDDSNRSFDKLLFIGIAVGGAAACTALLAERLYRGDREGAVVYGILGYLILPAFAYLWARYRARRPPPWYSAWVAKHVVKRKQG
jgi:hypothetical protein